MIKEEASLSQSESGGGLSMGNGSGGLPLAVAEGAAYKSHPSPVSSPNFLPHSYNLLQSIKNSTIVIANFVRLK